MTSVRQFGALGHRSLPNTRIFRVRLKGNCPASVVVSAVVAGATLAESAAGVAVVAVAGATVVASATVVAAEGGVADADGVVVTSLLCAATVSLLPVQLTQSNKRAIRPTRSAVSVWDADPKWCVRFTSTNLLELLRFVV